MPDLSSSVIAVGRVRQFASTFGGPAGDAKRSSSPGEPKKGPDRSVLQHKVSSPAPPLLQDACVAYAFRILAEGVA